MEMDLRDEDAIPAYVRISEKVLHLRRLGMTYTNIAKRLGINLWMAKKAAGRGRTVPIGS
jgi:hypothetical protein